jgi:hypothetical protein
MNPSPNLTQIRALAMKLPKSSRLRLANDLFETSSISPQTYSAAEILAEALKRDEEIQDGETAPLTLIEFLSQTQARRSQLSNA